MTTDNNQIKRWILPSPINEVEIDNCSINYTLQKVLSRRGLDLKNDLDGYLTPLDLPNPEDHFNELSKATGRIIEACRRNEKIAICGDYDADGITSTVLLVELLSKLGAKPIPYIPSRQDDGYGLNIKMINEINKIEINLVITVDNGISALKAINRSNELGIDLIITDHHKIPDFKIDVFAIIHPERSPSNSPYKYLAGVGIAYILAKNLCNKLNYDIYKSSANVLFCIGTIADMAPLIGANRKLLKEFLPQIRTTNNIGVKSIIKKLSIDQIDITPEVIAFKIAPLINAVGRIGDPKVILSLLSNKSEDHIDKHIKECFSLNKERKRLTQLIEKEALEIGQTQFSNGQKFLVLTNSEWHLGVIGIVAARMVEKFNLPTAIISLGNDGLFRGSIRSNNLLKVNHALDECSDLLIAHGGHAAAAGFTIKEENIPKLMKRINKIAIREFKDYNLDKTITPDAYINLVDINLDLYRQLMLIGPFGIMNNAPIFWTRKCRVLDIYRLKGGHIKMTLNDGSGSIDAIKWNNTKKIKTNDLIDIAFYIEINKWKAKTNVQLNLIDIKNYSNTIELKIHNHLYKCKFISNKDILITNNKGQSICSRLSTHSKFNKSQEVFAKKILTFAEIALGKAA
ncbi:single-stranded-DNA-specific exonuclease RecJ [Prochlorococcus marinus]|uniref:single-stranded-DNA-specific exonuclease RecJ n=1 Tax=Prochlorococcus marinus TaxID=1219 RepID=UPI0022B32E33|nr:single-stranded-DNA-specific exonuclease RecJ [Prochlorococcus marinus]